MARRQQRLSRLRSADWWFRDRNGHLVIAQWPNAALWVWVTAEAASLLWSSSQHAAVFADVSGGALLVWAAEEMTRGVTPFRRVLGTMVLVGEGVHLLR